MATEIKCEKKVIREIFNMWYCIPDYQRAYVWDTDQVRDLLDDTISAYRENKEAQYFLGSMVLKINEKSENNVSYTEYELLDGQQRITTVFLILACMRDMLATQILKVRHEQNAFLSLATLVSETEQDFLLNKTNDNMYKQAAAEDREQPLQQYEDIYEMNRDFVGWLRIPNTNIDYPVMFTPNDPEYYLHRAFDNTDSHCGTPFIGENGNMDSDCFIIYGHNMKNDTMLGTLDHYADIDFWKANRTFSFNTLYEYREYEVFAAVKTSILHTDEEGLRYYNYAGELSEADYKKFEDWLIANSIYDTEIHPVYGEQILILSTCSYHTDNGRFLVAARRIK